MATGKDTKDSYVEKEREKVASVMQHQGFTVISNGRSVIECFQCEENIMENFFHNLYVRDRFLLIFSKGNNQKGKLFLQYGDPSQSCKMSHEAMDKIPYRLFMIPLQSPDLNHIENIFHFVDMCLRKDVITKKIKRETYEQFCNHINNTFDNFPSDVIDRTIASIPKLIDAAIKMKGQQEHHWEMTILLEKF